MFSIKRALPYNNILFNVTGATKRLRTGMVLHKVELLHDRGISVKVPILIEINISHNFQYIFKLSIPDIYKYILALIPRFYLASRYPFVL